MAIQFVNNTVTTAQTVGAEDQLIVGTEGNLVVNGDDAVHMLGNGSLVTVRGLVASSSNVISTELENGGTGIFNNLSVRIDDQGMLTGDTGIYLVGAGNSVLNDGMISADTVGILLSGQGSTITNHGLVEGWLGAVSAYGGGDIQVINTGSMSATVGSAVSISNSAGFLLRNEGTIQHATSNLIGAAVDLVDASGRVENTGSIGSGDFGVRALASGPGGAMLDLFNSGVISGGKGSVKVEEGVAATIVNAGSLIGDVELASADDLYDGREGKLIGVASMGAGNDTALGGAAVDSIAGGAGNDLIEGNGGADVLRGDAGDDTIDGGAGNDLIWDGDGVDEVDAGAGNDQVISGNGADMLEGGLGWDTLSYNFSTAGVTVNLATGKGFGGDAQGDLVSGFERLIGSAFADKLTGSSGKDTIHGQGGNDLVNGGDGSDMLRGGGGADTIDGGNGNDTIEGGWGRDLLTGGAGADLFRFRAAGESGTTAGTRDVVTDFVKGADLLDLSLIDPDGVAAGDQAFAFRGTSAFTGSAAEVRYFQSGGNTIVEVDADANGAADMALQLNGLVALAAGDFIL